MARAIRRWTIGSGAAVVAAILVPMSFAWACVGLVSITTSSSTVQPGATLTLTGQEFAPGSPVLIHLDSLTGPVLATVAKAGDDSMTSKFTVMVTIPTSIETGPHLLIATQDEHDMNGGNPARAQIYVGTAAPAPAAPASRLKALTVTTGAGAGTLAVVGLAVFGGSLLLGGLVLLVVGRRRPQAETGSAR